MLQPRAQSGDPIERIKGISMASWRMNNYGRPQSDLSLAALKATGAEWVAIIPTVNQETIDSTTLIKNGTASDEALQHAIEQAHQLGLKVMFKMHLNPTDQSYGGYIGKNFTPAQWDQWFQSYAGYLLSYARLAEANQVEMFCVGTELDVSQQQEEHWRALIRSVRAEFHGLLVYAANHGAEEDVPWWDAVDLIGVDAYYPLSSQPNPTLAQIQQGWQPHIASLGRLSQKWNRPVIFTEIGYASMDRAAAEPANQRVGQPNPDLQARLYQAAFDLLTPQPWFKGFFWWGWDDSVYQGSSCDNSHTPKGKPAENVIRAAYGAPAIELSDPALNLPAFKEDAAPSLDLFTDAFHSMLAPEWSWNAEISLVHEPVFKGTTAAKVVFQPSSGFSPHMDNFDTTPYRWLEFSINPSEANPPLYLSFADDQDEFLLERRVDACWYAEGDDIPANTWTRIVIPLDQVDANDRLIQRIALLWYQDHPVTIYLDEMRLIGAQ
jgi:hypothetical protein